MDQEIELAEPNFIPLGQAEAAEAVYLGVVGSPRQRGQADSGVVTSGVSDLMSSPARGPTKRSKPNGGLMSGSMIVHVVVE